MVLTFVASVITFFALRSLPAAQRSNVSDGFTWIQAGRFSVDFRFLTDPLSVTMILFVTGVGSLIHLYAIGYMHGDPFSAGSSPTSISSRPRCWCWCWGRASC